MRKQHNQETIKKKVSYKVTNWKGHNKALKKEVL